MPAKLNAYPSYFIADRSGNLFSTNVLTDLATDLIEGDLGLLRDSNLTTSYDVTASVAALANGGITTTFDLGLIYWTPLFYLNADFVSAGTGTYQIIIDYSTDNITWTNLVTDSIANGIRNEIKSQVLNPIRYIRTKFYTGGGTGGTFTVKYYELRISGSV
jgi:hypothetical protein